MIVKLTIYQDVSSPSKIEGAGGSMKIQLSFYQNCCYRSGVILPLWRVCQNVIKDAAPPLR